MDHALAVQKVEGWGLGAGGGLRKGCPSLRGTIFEIAPRVHGAWPVRNDPQSERGYGLGVLSYAIEATSFGGEIALSSS